MLKFTQDKIHIAVIIENNSNIFNFYAALKLNYQL